MNIKEALKKIIPYSVILFIMYFLYWGIAEIDTIPISSAIVLISLILFLFLKNIVLIENRKYLTIYCLAFVIKFGLLIYDVANKNLPMTSGDFQVYHMFANELISSSDGILGILSFSNGTDFYAKINAIAYILLDNNWNIPYFLSFIYSLILSIYIYKSAVLITKNKDKAGFIVILWMITPIEMIYSITFLKESFMQMLFIISFYKMLSYLNTGNRADILIAILVAAMNAMIHSGVISVVLVYAVFLAFYSFKEKKVKITMGAAIALIMIIAIVFVSPAGSALMSRFQGIESSEDLLESTQTIAGNTTYVSSTPSNMFDIVLQTPYRFLMFAISPLPWQVKSVGTAIALLLDGILQYFIVAFYFAFIFIYRAKDNEDKLYKLLSVSIVISTYLVYAWGTNNFGTAMRHRLKVYPMTIIIIYTYWPKIKEVLAERRNLKNEITS